MITHSTGTGNVTPRKGQTVSVTATGFIVAGEKKFWSTTDKYGDRPAKWIVGKGAQPEGFDRAIQSMRIGERASFTISPTFAYGVAGEAKYGVPGNANVRMEFKLLKIEETPERL